MVALYSLLDGEASSSSSYTVPPPPAWTPVCASTNVWGALPVPVVLVEALLFCGLSVGMTSCCTVMDDAALMGQYLQHLANGSDQACPPATIKAMLCSRCIPSSDPDAPKTPALGDLICTASPPPPSSTTNLDELCLERIAAGSYHGFTPYYSNDDNTRSRAFLWTRGAKIWAVSVPGSGGAAKLVGAGARPFLDLADRVHHDAARGLGLMGVAPHPGFASTGRLFVSYACDSIAAPSCAGASAAEAPPAPPSRACRYLLVVAEFRAAKDSAATDYSKVRRIFNACLRDDAESSSPEQRHAGQLLFRSGDHYYMYLILGTGGGNSDGQLDFSSQNKSGEIIRFDVRDTTAGRQGSGNASMEAEVFASGMGALLKGCSVDSGMPYHFYCAGVDEQCNEQVYLISDKPGSYSASSGKVAAATSIIIDHGRPPATGGGGPAPPSIVAGLVYRGRADPSLRGRYLYMYGSAEWAAMAGSGRYVPTRIPNVRCSRSSPVPCVIGGGGRVLSFGEGGYYSNDAFLLATDGVYRVAPPGRLCGAPPSAPANVAPATAKFWVILALGSILAFALPLVCAKILGCRLQLTATTS